MKLGGARRLGGSFKIEAEVEMEDLELDDRDDPAVGTCQVCGRYTSDKYCYASDRCKEVGGADVL
jgi:hypothetical protein